MRLLRFLALTAALLLASTHLVFGAALYWAKQTDHQIIVVTGGSMAPTFEAGDAIVVNRNLDELEEGDIITYQSNQGLTTHRLVAFHEVEGRPYVQTKGDANEKPDPDFTDLEAVVGSVEKSYSKLGFFLNFLSSRLGLLITLGPLLLYIVVYELREALRLWREDAQEAEAVPAPAVEKGGRRKRVKAPS